MNIVMLSEHDYAGSGWRMVEAIRQHTGHSILHVKATPHKYGYKTDCLFTKEAFPIIQEAVEKADIIHFKGDDLPTRDWHGIRIPERTKIIVTVGGSFFRRNGGKGKLHPISEYVEKSDFRTALSPDLNYEEFKSLYTPYLIDSESVGPTWNWQPGQKLVIGCYPGMYGEKGFESVIIPALDLLRREGGNFETTLTTGMTHKQSIEAKREMSVFIDQISVGGCYGNSALEAMQFGVPVIAYISSESLARATDVFRNSPVLNCGRTKDGLYLLFKRILSGEIDLKSVSRKTKAYCDGFHSYSAGARMWDEIYRKVLNGRVS